MTLKDLPLFANLEAAEPAATSVAEPRHWTVTELTTQIKGAIEPAFQQVWVQGEVSNCRPLSASGSGHLYFSLKDQGSCISSAIFGWGARAKSKSFEIKDGLQLLCRGKVSLYPPRGTYQLVIDQVEPLGAGALQVAFEQLKAKLQAEGLFDAKRKRKLPPFPSRIAIVTSPTGAAIQDMLNILRRRAPHIRVTVVPAVVQGEEAPRQIIRGLEQAIRHELGEMVILARGGGSIEDLWGFNDEALARAIAASPIPVVSAVGHEIDFTISDFVSDVRAPTPSAAAEILSAYWVEAGSWLTDASQRLRNAILRDLTARKDRLGHVAARVLSPRDRVREQSQRCDEYLIRLERAFRARMDRKRSLVEQSMGKLDALSPLRVLERGYSILREPESGPVVKRAAELVAGKDYEVTFQDGKKTVRGL